MSNNESENFPNVFEVSDWFWQIIDNAKIDQNRLYSILKSMTKDEVLKFHNEFNTACQFLHDSKFTSHIGVRMSDDNLQDIAWWIVSQGKQFFFNVWSNPNLFPKYVDPANKGILYGISADVYEEKGGNIEDLDYF
jgi:hypothetical protein